MKIKSCPFCGGRAGLDMAGSSYGKYINDRKELTTNPSIFHVVYFCTKNKKLKKEWLDCLAYPILPYPKGDDNEDYVLGEYLKEQLIRIQ